MKKYTVLLDSSVNDLSVGVAFNGEIIALTSFYAWQKQSEYMVEELDRLLKDNKISRDEIKDIMVSIGPASYTGVRIALTIAKVMAFALSIPVYPASSLQVLKHGNSPSICLINARSDRSYIGVYEGEKEILKDQIMDNEEVLKYINEHPDYVVCGETKYLGIDGYKGNVIKEMLSLKESTTPINDSSALNPVYLKGKV
ncbi:MAG: tRNA (adenosine(37)-N6)-threonylcarbamoyltransferase complex dimerization subunit type 1 TsaB [Coprobacillus sp.]|nr:tRNA (adenosine(37)-N6)-threonylcarbamoyltransferase complex dimerization subunit type 1 TsaB [Coprobacillus sp.]